MSIIPNRGEPPSNVGTDGWPEGVPSFAEAPGFEASITPYIHAPETFETLFQPLKHEPGGVTWKVEGFWRTGEIREGRNRIYVVEGYQGLSGCVIVVDVHYDHGGCQIEFVCAEPLPELDEAEDDSGVL